MLKEQDEIEAEGGGAPIEGPRAGEAPDRAQEGVKTQGVQAHNVKDEQDKKEKKACLKKKRSSPPYILWCKDQSYLLIKKESLEAEFKEISNILGLKWKNATAEEKKPYEEKYQAEKEAYM
ncbi:hypothetical protein CDL15_Pgr014458 [Punica granatum]|uniref:HMG box domain-containing protein n=1 Tax=Punica granatum TaxID=22663 RepID=A0A218WD79_PUNGR|nr:hypothetical protein CDL15_Pgr014458 [Punica granatum]